MLVLLLVSLKIESLRRVAKHVYFFVKMKIKVKSDKVNKAGITVKKSISKNFSRPVSVPMTPSMVGAIKASPKGKIPAGLARWLASHKKAKK